MKKIYTKPSLLSETFVAKNIMNEDLEQNALSTTGLSLYLDGRQYNFTLGQNQLNTISISDFVGNN